MTLVRYRPVRYCQGLSSLRPVRLGGYGAAMETRPDLIPVQRCWDLLAMASVGRLALSVQALPVILPVQYCVAGRRLVVCLGHHAIPDRALRGTIVAFSADAIDPGTRSGWSVQVQGRSSIPRQDGSGTACGEPTAGQVVEIDARTITGYYVHLCPFIETLLTSRHGSN